MTDEEKNAQGIADNVGDAIQHGTTALSTPPGNVIVLAGLAVLCAFGIIAGVAWLGSVQEEASTREVGGFLREMQNSANRAVENATSTCERMMQNQAVQLSAICTEAMNTLGEDGARAGEVVRDLTKSVGTIAEEKAEQTP